jgi:16S rRNA (guanine966-N2)-methyltransferase
VAKQPRRKPTKTAHRVRLIAGEWRGRQLDVLDSAGLRPTANRLRETLFNWLQPYLTGATCLDAFAGTGALGFEAASRGAAQVWMLDSQYPVVQQLKQHCVTLSAKQVQVEQIDACQFLQQTQQQFDIVFLDPPFQQQHLQKCCQLLNDADCLKTKALIYLEMEKTQQISDLDLPITWLVLKSHQSKQVNAYLLQINPTNIPESIV